MQTLHLEPAWERTISMQDYQLINKLFLRRQNAPRLFQEMSLAQLCMEGHSSVLLFPIWHAVNHSGDLLVTALIENQTNQVLNIVDEMITYCYEEKKLAKAPFTLTQVLLKPHTTVPWTFIFPHVSLEQTLSSQERKLVL